jgi:hypothetical protein
VSIFDLRLPHGLSIDYNQLRRRWTLDDERLRAAVEHPPAAHATILGTLLSLCFADAIRRAYATTAARCVAEPPPELGAEALGELLCVLTENEARYELRARLASLELVGLFEADEPDTGLEPDDGRWYRLLHEYTRVLDVQLHERLAAIVERRGATADAKTTHEVWNDLLDLRQLDACVGVLLARAAMLDPRPRPSALGPLDEMSTDAVGSFAWWCRWFLDAWDDDYPLGERLDGQEIEGFVRSARLSLGELDPVVLAALVRVFPAIEQ